MIRHETGSTLPLHAIVSIVACNTSYIIHLLQSNQRAVAQVQHICRTGKLPGAPIMVREAGVVSGGVCHCVFVCLCTQNKKNYWIEI